MKYKGGKRTDRAPISYRVEGHRLKVNASKSYSVHSLVLLLFSLTLSVPGQRESELVIEEHMGVFNPDMVTVHISWDLGKSFDFWWPSRLFKKLLFPTVSRMPQEWNFFIARLLFG